MDLMKVRKRVYTNSQMNNLLFMLRGNFSGVEKSSLKMQNKAHKVQKEKNI